MKHFVFALALSFVVTLAACDSTPLDNETEAASDAITSADQVVNQTAAEPSPQTGDTMAPSLPDAPHRFASWAGKWTGVEGMYLIVTPTADERYSLEMQYDLDNRVTIEGRDSEHGIRFTRGGEALSLTRASGNEIGLKYLAGKTQCLMVKPGEGYCRD